MKFNQPVNTVVIANIEEFYLPFFRKFDEKEVKAWVELSRAESDMALFWGGDDKLVIVPYSIDENFLRDVQDSLRYQNIRVIAPEKISESICTDIMLDQNLYSLLVDTLRNSKNPQIIAWGATKQFYTLINRLRQDGVNFYVPETPSPENYWTVRYLNSKSGFREFCTLLAQQDTNIRIPHGLICANFNMATMVAQSYFAQHKGVVVKSDSSIGGYGVLLYSVEKLATIRNFEMHLQTNARLAPIFSSGPIVVEDFIAPPPGCKAPSPSIQVLVDPSGKVTVTCLAEQIVGSGGKYLGAIISSEIFSKAQINDLCTIGTTVGKAVAKLGYRGIFNIDTVLDMNGRVYCVEINARRTSVTYSLEIGRHLINSSMFSTQPTIISNERFSSEDLSGYSYNDIRQLLSELLFPIKAEPKGILITIASSLKHFVRAPRLGFVVIHRDMQDAVSLYHHARELLGSPIG